MVVDTSGQGLLPPAIWISSFSATFFREPFFSSWCQRTTSAGTFLHRRTIRISSRKEPFSSLHFANLHFSHFSHTSPKDGGCPPSPPSGTHTFPPLQNLQVATNQLEGKKLIFHSQLFTSAKIPLFCSLSQRISTTDSGDYHRRTAFRPPELVRNWRARSKI